LTEGKKIITFLILACILVPGLVYFALPVFYTTSLRVRLRRRVRKLNSLVLTFDDGPGNTLTPALLRILQQYDAKATFFLSGRHIKGREQAVRQIAQKGHELCSHGFNHVHHWRALPHRTIEDIRQGWRAIDAALGEKRGRYPFRPPYGKLNIVSLLYLLFVGAPIVYWTVDTGDTRPGSKCCLKRALLGGAVTLAHDFDRTDASINEAVLESTEEALNLARQTGMKVVPVCQLLGYDR